MLRRLGALAVALLGAGGCNTLVGIDDGKARPLDAGIDSGEGGGGGAVDPCGDGQQALGEACDDGDGDDGDGCSAACAIEPGFGCEGEPSACAPICGDGLVLGAEGCDDGDSEAGDGCGASCAPEHGFTCLGQPSACLSECGDGLVAASIEACDDGNAASGDGCSMCAVEPAWTCAGEPSVCATTCGDGVLDAGEACDDGGLAPGDCCSEACATEPGCEVEPNDTHATANAFVPLAVDGVMKAHIDPSGDVDVFSITVPAGDLASIVAATGDGFAGSACGASVDTIVTIAGAIVLASDDDGGVGTCSSAAVRVLGPGTYDVEVRASGAQALATFDYTLAIALAICGDGVVDAPETCEGAGCNALCGVEDIVEAEPNDAQATAEGPFIPRVLVAGGIEPGADVDWFAIDVPATADLRLETFDGPLLDACGAVDTLVQLVSPSGLLATDDDGGLGLCSKIDGATHPEARHVPAGIYYASVTSSSGTIAVPGYVLLVDLDALCGDGVVEGSEECDGTAGCDAACDRVPVCGDGLVDAPEGCDDGNTTPLDGCTADCARLEEIEPNDTQAEAAQLAPLIGFTGSATIFGSLGVIGDVDVLQIDLAASTVVRLETFDASGTDCAAPTATTLRLFDANGQIAIDDASGILGCSALALRLAAGTYYASVEEAGKDASLAAYALQLAVHTSVGGESEPNDDEASADPFAGTDVLIHGDHQANADADVFAITLPQGGSVRAELIEGGGETCESGGIDSQLVLSGVASPPSDDDGGRGACSRIDGTGQLSVHGGAHALAPGTYFLTVLASPTAQSGANGQFDYDLLVTVR